ncbi:hypothetical protein [Psychromonas ossibalaenae]|uniref:hypothetical protein n=1 Tax=Psychromonas ossibalaenae TaxID=444922 RepID=UPI0003714961|nr:hypothetical protein [Psychromonas ossibalaenae]
MLKKAFNYYKVYGVILTLLACKLVFVRGITLLFYRIKHRNSTQYIDPLQAELLQIESEFNELGITVEDYYVDIEKYKKFQSDFPFPDNYHGGKKSGIWDEKILEHYVAYDLLNLDDYQESDIYLDIAACNSPWGNILSDAKINSYAIDLEKSKCYSALPNYRVMDATKTDFQCNSVRGASLQCAYEMFVDTADVKLIGELSRVLQKGGKAVISPLYMHTHACHYTSPNFYKKGYGDRDSKEYIHWNAGEVPSSRKYSALKLRDRVLRVIAEENMNYRLYAVRNKLDVGESIYLHFILEIIK